jgi:hypothetical protein
MIRAIENQHAALYKNIVRVRQSIATLEEAVPQVISLFAAYETLEVVPDSKHRDEFIVLLRMLPRLRTALKPEGPIRKPWHVPAEAIGFSAMIAWKRAGRVKFAAKPTSPIVRFTEEFLARAEGIERDPEAIAAVFERGWARRIAKKSCN